MEKKTKQNLLLVIVGVVLFAALTNLSAVIGFLGKVIGIIMPVIVGGILAMFINVPMTGIEKRLRRIFAKTKKKLPEKFFRGTSFILTLLCIVLVLTCVFKLLVPELVSSMKGIYSLVEVRLPQWIAYLESLDPGAEWLEKTLESFNLEKIMQNLNSGINLFFNSMMSIVSSTASTIMTAAFGLIIGIYMMLGKERVCRHANILVSAYLPSKVSAAAIKFCRKFSSSFANYLAGQCGEAVILGTLMFLVFTIFKLPYASLIGVLTAVCAIIPYVGAFFSCSLSIFLTLLIDPTLVLRCAIVYLVVQFVENQFIYPKVVGGSVGLPPLYTLIAAMIGGKLFGILGIIFFIPLTAVTIELIKENAKGRLLCRKADVGE